MRRAAAKSPPGIDATAMEAIERFVGILARCGCSPRDMTRIFSEACARVPDALVKAAGRSTRELSDASHILTVWFSDPLYLDHDGRPIRLGVHGPAPSLEALVARIDPRLDVDEVLRYLRRNHALRKIGTRYVPKGRALVLRNTRGPDHFRNMRGLLAMLRTLEHNTRPKRRVPGWFERFAENPAFPASARATFDARLYQHGMKFLRAMDADMHRQELRRKQGEPVVRIGVGVYRFEEEIPAIRHAVRRERTRK